MAVTKKVKDTAEYQQWVTGDLTNGDVLDVYTSLGGRAAHSVTIESIGGQSTIRFNVVTKVYKEHGPMHNPFLAQGQGGPKHSPYEVAEIEEVKPNIVVESGDTHTWDNTEIAVTDIKIVTKSSGIKITVT